MFVTLEVYVTIIFLSQVENVSPLILRFQYWLVFPRRLTRESFSPKTLYPFPIEEKYLFAGLSDKEHTES